jgi:hypothetical protein
VTPARDSFAFRGEGVPGRGVGSDGGRRLANTSSLSGRSFDLPAGYLRHPAADGIRRVGVWVGWKVPAERQDRAA